MALIRKPGRVPIVEEPLNEEARPGDNGTRYYITGLRPAKVVGDGATWACYVFDWETRELVRDDRYRHYLFHSHDTDEVTKEVFLERVAALRAETRPKEVTPARSILDQVARATHLRREPRRPDPTPADELRELLARDWESPERQDPRYAGAYFVIGVGLLACGRIELLSEVLTLIPPPPLPMRALLTPLTRLIPFPSEADPRNDPEAARAWAARVVGRLSFDEALGVYRLDPDE